MSRMFQRAPFSLRRSEELTLLCRYLVEENHEPFVMIDLERRQTIECIRSIFKTLIGHYSLLEPEQQSRIYQTLSGILTKYEKGLRDQFRFFIQNRKPAEKTVMESFVENYLADHPDNTFNSKAGSQQQFLAVNREELYTGLSFIDRELSI